MSAVVAWSYSVLNSFETCAYRHFKTKVEKTVTEQQGEELLYGNRVHKALEHRVKSKQPLPGSMGQWEPMVQRLELSAVGGRIVAEQQLALDQNYRATGWFGKGATAPWVRGITDLTIYKGEKAAVFDYKTGKRDPVNAQLRLTAAMTFAINPHIKLIHNAFLWLKTNEIDSEVFTRADVPAIWQEFMPRVRRLEIAHEAGVWPKKPSGLCKNHCPVPKAMCEYRGA